MLPAVAAMAFVIREREPTAKSELALRALGFGGLAHGIVAAGTVVGRNFCGGRGV